MKRNYQTPNVEIVKFQYRDQVVAASGGGCMKKWVNVGGNWCEGENSFQTWIGNQA